MRDRAEVAWAAGLFEGEGCFTMTDHAGASRRLTQGRIELAMTDEDDVRRFHAVMGFGAVDGPLQRPSRGSRKPYWRWRAWTFETIQATVAMFWPWLGARRRARAREVLSGLRERTKSWSQRYPGHDGRD